MFDVLVWRRGTFAQDILLAVKIDTVILKLNLSQGHFCLGLDRITMRLVELVRLVAEVLLLLLLLLDFIALYLLQSILRNLCMLL